MPSFLTPLLDGRASAFHLVNTRTGRVVAHEILTAFDSAARRTGLLSRAHLAEGSAMVIAPTSAVHTFFMRFPIDVVFVARDGCVLKIRRHVKPWRVAGALGAHAVIEFATGSLEGSGTATGDRLAVEAR